MRRLLISCFLIIIFFGFSWAQTGRLTVHQDSKIEELVLLKKDLEKKNKLTDGFTIQLYYGDKGNANSVLKRYQNLFSSWPASIEYETPNYKVWVGNFNSRFDADRALLEVIKKFPSAFILKPERS